MGRATVIRGVTFPGRIAWEGRIARLLAAANGRTQFGGHRLEATTPEIDAAIEAIASGRVLELAPDSTMTAWDWITLRTWSAYERAGALHTRRCPVCQRWCATHGKRHTCYRSDCATAYKKTDARRRAKRSYQTPGAKRQRELQRRPNLTKTGT